MFKTGKLANVCAMPHFIYTKTVLIKNSIRYAILVRPAEIPESKKSVATC